MDIKYIDLDKYANMLKEVRRLQMEFEIKRHRSNRIALISYEIFSRLLFDKENIILEKRKEKFGLELDKVESEIKETKKGLKRLCGIDNLKSLNNKELKIEISWFVPYRHEWDVINLLRESSFDTEREEFDRMIYYSTKENLEGIIKDVKESVYQKIYENGIVEYYKKGNLIPIVVDKKKENWKELVENERNSKSVIIGIDLGMYDFVKYLDSLKKEERADLSIISKNRKSIEPLFDELFIDKDAMNKAVLGMKKTGMINDNFNYLMGGNRSFIFSFIEVCRELGLICFDIPENVVTRVITVKLGLGEKRFGKSNKSEKVKIRKVF